MSAAGGPNIITAASRGDRNSLVFYLDHRKSFRLGKDLKNDIDLTLQNGITTNTYDGVRAIGFDGSNDRIEFPTITLSTAWTISYWFYHNSSDYNMLIGNKDNDGSRFYHRDTGSSYKIRVHNNDHLNIQDFTLGEERRYKWTHISYAKNASRVYGWMNGEPLMDLANSDDPTFTVNCVGWPYAASTSYHWNGGLNFITVHDKVLNNKQVKRLYNRHRKYFGL